MTTIAVRDGVMVADTAITGLGTCLGEVKKIHRIGDSIWAASGTINDALDFLDALRAGEWDELGNMEFMNPDQFAALELTKEGEVYTWGSTCRRLPIEGPFHATGSGMELALGAMGAGADAETAVRIAARFDVHTREPIQVMSW